jgi:subtilase family serine protease
VSAFSGPSSAVAGAGVSVTVTTKNQGGDAAPVSFTRFYLSSNSSLDAGDQPIGAREVSSLGPGLSDAGSALLLIPPSTPTGTYYIIAKGDGDDAVQESQETNNLSSRTISIAGMP